MNGHAPDATIHHDGHRFRDLDHDGVVAPYEDHRLPATVRADDLLHRMTLDEKVALMMHGTAPAVGSPLAHIGIGTGYDLDALGHLIGTVGVNSLISRLSLRPEELAAQNNALQSIAANSRLGIPVTLSTDPRSHFATVTGASVDTAGFSQWPETLGLAATGDVELVRRFGDIVRQEYRAVGFHMALSPQADLATSPMWPRIEGTFGEDPALVRRLTGAYVEGIQGSTSGPGADGVAAIVKHWVGYGAARDGFDGHNYYGRFSAFPAGRFQDHVDAFLDAFAVKVAGVMPTYNILDGLVIDGIPVEPVGAGFSHQLIDGLLRTTYQFDGIVVSDWSITKDMTDACRTGEPRQTPDLIAMPWGVEDLTQTERFAKGVLAGLDQFGGVNDPSALRDAVDRGMVSPERIDRSARAILILKFQLGLFDNPFVDAPSAPSVVGSRTFHDEGLAAQRRSLVRVSGTTTPMIGPDDMVFVVNAGTAGADHLSSALADHAIRVAPTLEDATVAVVQIAAPFETLHPGFFFGALQHEGSLEYGPDDPQRLLVDTTAAVARTIAVVHLDRPAVLGPIVDAADTVLIEFGASPTALASALTATTPPDGRLPVQLPRSMAAVHARPCDAPGSDPDPLFELFFGS